VWIVLFTIQLQLGVIQLHSSQLNLTHFLMSHANFFDITITLFAIGHFLDKLRVSQHFAQRFMINLTGVNSECDRQLLQKRLFEKFILLVV
jgi:hypothetical protein